MNTDGNEQDIIEHNRKPSELLSSRNNRPAAESPTLNINFVPNEILNSHETIAETNATAFRKDKIDTQNN